MIEGADARDLTYLEREQLHMFYSYCTFVMLVNGKHMNFSNIFITTLKNKYLLRVLKMMLGTDNSYEVIEYFLQQVPSLTKSKHVMKLINQLVQSKQLAV